MSLGSVSHTEARRELCIVAREGKHCVNRWTVVHTEEDTDLRIEAPIAYK